MSQESPSDHQNTQSDFLPEAPDSNTQTETQDTSPITYRPRISIQEPEPIIHTRRVSIQEPAPIIHTRRVSIQEPAPIIHTRRVSIQEPAPIIHTRRVSIQEPAPIIHTRRVSIQEPEPIIHTRRVSIQEPAPIIHTRRVSIQEPEPIIHTRRVSIQEPEPIIHTRRVSIQEPEPIIHTRRVSIQEPEPIIHTRRVSIQEPEPIIHTRRFSIQEPAPIIHTRRFSIQEPTPIIHARRFSIQEPPIIQNSEVSIQETSSISNSHLFSIQEIPPISHSRRVSIQETPLINNSCLNNIQETLSSSSSHQVSPEDTPPTINSHWAIIQDTPSATHSYYFNAQDVSPGFQTRHFSVLSPPVITHIPLTSRESVAYTSQVSFQDLLPTPQSHYASIQGPMSSPLAKVDDPHSITHSPGTNNKSFESSLWISKENVKDSFIRFQLNEHTLDSNVHSILSANTAEAESGRCRRRYSQLPLDWKLLYRGKKISRQLSLLLSLLGMVILGLITLGQPWIHFQVPLTAPGDPAGPMTIPINTILFVQCSDISCLQEYDQNAYLLDLAWAFLLFASLTSFCLCIILVNTIFSTSSNLPMLDFSNIIISSLTGTSMILGVLFYLMQAKHFLQEGMTYRLGRSFYLAWTGVFFFLMTGFFSYLNYMNFWSILAVQAIWT